MAAPIHRPSGGAETHFAKKLASNVKTVRDKAVKKLKMWLSSSRFVSSSGLSETDLLKLWRGLFYCMWMSDKPKIQEELAETIAQLLNNFGCTSSAFEFLSGFFKTMHREWHGIDRLRLDKFYLLIRKFIYQSILYLKKHDWGEEIVSQLNQVLENGPLNPTSNPVEFANGVQVHVIQVYLDELFKIDHAKLSSITFIKLLEPFSRLLTTSKSHVITRSISHSIFNPLLDKKKSDDSWSKLDFESLAEQFFTLASRKDIPGRNRNILYDYIGKFKKVNGGQGINVTGSTEIKEEVLNRVDSTSTSSNQEGEVLEKNNSIVEACSGDVVDIVNNNVSTEKNRMKRKRKRKSDTVLESSVTVAKQTASVGDDDCERSGKSQKIRNKENNNESSNKKSEKKKRKKKKEKNEAIMNGVKEGNETETQIMDQAEVEHMEEETSNLDGSYLGTITIPQRTFHIGDGKSETKAEVQHGNGTTDRDNMSPVLNISTAFVETLSTSSTPTTDTISKRNQSNNDQELNEVESKSPPLSMILRHSMKKANTDPRKKKERKRSINTQCNSAQAKGRKQVRIELSKNTSHTTKDYRQSLRASPVVPFDATKKPVQSSLKVQPTTTNNINKPGKRPSSIKRLTAVDFF